MQLAVAAAQESAVARNGGGAADLVGGFVLPDDRAIGQLQRVQFARFGGDQDFLAMEHRSGIDLPVGFEFPTLAAVGGRKGVDHAVVIAQDQRIPLDRRGRQKTGIDRDLPDQLAIGQVQAEDVPLGIGGVDPPRIDHRGRFESCRVGEVPKQGKRFGERGLDRSGRCEIAALDRPLGQAIGDRRHAEEAGQENAICFQRLHRVANRGLLELRGAEL